MENRTYMLERPWYYNGMTDEDFLYIDSQLKFMDEAFVTALLRKEIEFPPREVRTKKDVFKTLGLDIDYVFDINDL